MRLSIVIPFHKGTHFLKDCLDSLQEQTMQDFEIILVKDHVEEEVATLLSSYDKTLNIKEVNLENQTGVSAGRNLGVSMACGDFLYFMDSDDYLKEDALEEICKTNSKADVVYGRILYTWFNRFVYTESDNATVSDQEYTKRSLRDLVLNRMHPREISILNLCINRKWFIEEKIKFQEDLKYYSDITVLAEILQQAEKIEYCETAEYVKRLHNDEILYPSLSRGYFEDREDQLILTYERLSQCKIDTRILDAFQVKWAQYCRMTLVKLLRKDKGSKWSQSQYVRFHKYAKTVNPQIKKQLTRQERKTLEALCQDEYKACRKKINRMLAITKLGKMIQSRRFFYRTINHYVFTKFSQRNDWIVFESFLGKQYSDSCRYIYEELQKTKGNQYRYIWIINDKNIEIPGDVTRVKRFSLKYFYYMTRAKYWVNNMRQPVWFEKRDSQVMLETWHGTPLKKLVFDMEDVTSASPTYKKTVFTQSRAWDYLIADNPFSYEVFQSCFLFEKEKILKLGYPRNDILYLKNNDTQISKLKEQIGIPKDKKVLLYAPTWRDDEYYDKGEYKFQLKLDLPKLKEAIGDEYVVLLRTHYFIADSIDTTGIEDFAINVSKYPDIADLYLVSDICMTDYSSVFFDYANLKRPILFFTYDLEKYRDVLRGFYIDIEKEVPGPLLFTNEEVIQSIKGIDQVEAEYKEKYDAFYERFCCWDDGYAAKRVVKAVFEK
ncbi:MAG: CDP-glycerol glycerophosphotransferase family protein [Anaerostipes sp.]|nr:CDP-glycerol glycerophosphotransferase family protein [Anaerostipes sp.]